MPHSIEIQSDPLIARVRVEGAVDLSYWRWVLYDAIRQTRTPEVSRFLLDLTSADLHLEPDELTDLGEMLRRVLTSSVQLACLCPAGADSPLPAGTIEVGNLERVHLFDSEEDAVRWLLGGAQEAAA